jgi:hypothetical protein
VVRVSLHLLEVREENTGFLCAAVLMLSVSGTSMSLRAPNVMRWTRTMDECLEVLETSPAALPSDKVLCRHIRLQHITEEFEMQLSAEETYTPDINRAISEAGDTSCYQAAAQRMA